jgi:hypothetical protein
LNKRSLWISASAALLIAAGLAGCGTTSYFGGRVLPPSGLSNRVMIAIQNPSVFTKGALEIVDAYYDIRSGRTGQPTSFSVSGYGGALPISIQSMPEENVAAVYGSGDGTLTTVNYQIGEDYGHGRGLEWTFLKHLHDPQWDVYFRGQPGFTRVYNREPGERRLLSAKPARRLPGERESRRLNGAGVC